MRIIHTADWHLGKNLEGQSRMDEQELFLADFINLVEQQKADLILIAGDIYDSTNPPARAEKLFYDTLKKLSKHGERLILIIAGNHDNPERLVAAGPLAMEHGIVMVGTPKTTILEGTYGQHQVIEAGEGYLEVDIRGERAVILTVPYPSEKRLNEVLYDGMEEDKEKAQSYEERIRLLFQELATHYREDTINLLMSHLFVIGAKTEGSERAIELGGTYLIDSSVFPKEAQYVALGHIHKPQVVPNTDGRVRYSGSPIHYNRTEISYEKSVIFLEATVDDCQISTIPLPVYKPIEVWNCDSVTEAIERCEENKERNCWVYMEIKTDHYIREDEIKEMKSRKKDILSIRPITNQEQEEEQFSLSERPFEEVFQEFYRKERGVEVTKETLDVLNAILEGEEA